VGEHQHQLAYQCSLCEKFLHTQKVLKLKHNGDMEMGHLWLKVAVKLPHKRTNRSSYVHHCTTGSQLAFFLNEANDWSSCFSNLSKSYTAVLQATEHEGLRSFYDDCHTKMAMPTKKARDTFFLLCFWDQVNNFSHSLQHKRLLQWLVERVM